MTLEESREVIPMMESMINQIEEQQKLMAEMVQELQERDRQLLIAEESHIVWIPGRRMSSYYQVGDQTKKILKIKIMEE